MSEKRSYGDKHYFIKIIEQDGGHDILSCLGVLSCKIPCLAKNSAGNIVTPTFVEKEGDNEGIYVRASDNYDNNFFAYQKNKEVPIKASVITGGKLKRLYLISFDVNDVKRYFRLDAFGFMAKKLQMFFDRGEDVMVLAHKVPSKAETGSSKDEEVWVLDEISKVIGDTENAKSMRKILAEARKKTFSENQYKQVEKERDLSFKEKNTLLAENEKLKLEFDAMKKELSAKTEALEKANSSIEKLERKHLEEEKQEIEQEIVEEPEKNGLLESPFAIEPE